MRVAIHHIAATSATGASLHFTTTTRLMAEREQVITGLRGLSWVTLDHDLRDTVLGVGECITVPARREVIVTSLRPEAPFEVSVTPKAAARPASALVDGQAAPPAAQRLPSARAANREPGWLAPCAAPQPHG